MQLEIFEFTYNNLVFQNFRCEILSRITRGEQSVEKDIWL